MVSPFSEFSDDDKLRERELDAVIGEVVDRQLREHLTAVLGSWRRTWASAPPTVPFAVQGDRAIHPGELEHSRRREREAVESRECAALVRATVERVNRLERYLVIKR